MMKVNEINNVFFRGSVQNIGLVSVPQDKMEINTSRNSNKELGVNSLISSTPDYGIKIPQRYTKTGVEDLPNGLKLHSYKLANGYKVSIIPMEDSPAVVKTYVNVGAFNETSDIKGISHFLEHMAFNGTNGDNGHIKLNTGDSFKQIEKLGGWANASTNYALTDYINSAPLLDKKDLETQIKVLAAMSEDLKLSDEMIKKEKGPVSSEINMILDNPQTIAMDQTVRTLYNIKNPADELIGGSVNHIQNLTRKDVMDYYNKYYSPENTNIVITGDVSPDEAIALVSKNFVSNKRSKGERYEEKLTPIEKTVRKDFISDKAKSAEIVLGFNGPKNNSAKEKILYLLASNYLESEKVGLRKKLKDFNSYPSIDSERISTKTDGNRMIYLGTSASDKNVENVLKTIFNTINNIEPISDEQLQKIKNNMKENREENYEYSEAVNNIIGNAVLDGNLDYTLNYNEILEGITAEEVNDAVKKYFDLNKTAITVVHPKEISEISFKGHSRKPINEEKISTETLNNNFEVGFYETKSPKQVVSVKFATDVPYNKKAGVRDVLDEIYSMGTKYLDENSFNKLKEDLNLGIWATAGAGGLSVNIDGNNKNYKQALNLARDLIYNPRINEDTLKKAKEKIKEGIERSQTTASSLYYNKFVSKYNEYAYSKDEILKGLESITVDDVKDFHNYILQNSRGTVSANISTENEGIKETIVDFAEGLHKVKPNVLQENAMYKKLTTPVVLTYAQKNSQADIKQVYNFKYEDSIKNKVTARLLNSILSNSSIGLFDTLREKEHLAYSVYSDISTEDDLGELSLNIKTTTDNKEIGEQSYENLQRSIDGFKRQINELQEGKFTDEDLENSKKNMKAGLLEQEGAQAKVISLKSGLNSKYGANYDNQIFDEIDNVTKEDIINLAKKIFAQNPVYAITATQDTLDANKDYLDNLRLTV